MSIRPRALAWALVASFAALPARPAAQAPDSNPPPAAASPAPAPTSPDLDRIKRALNQPPALTLDANQLRFYLEIIAKQPRFSDYVKGYDFMNGATRRGNPMTHQEFLTMVTPKEMYSSAGITATDMLQFALTNWLGKALIQKAVEDLKNAKSDREAQEIRDRITHELEALNASEGRQR
jgi:hypothetical protein